MKDKLYLQQTAHNIGIELVKFSKNKKNACIFGLINENVDDLFETLCFLHSETSFGKLNIKDDVFFDKDTKLEDIYDKYDAILMIDCVRHFNDYDVKLKFIDDKIAKLVFYTKGILDYGNLNTLILNYEQDIYDLESKENNNGSRTIVRSIKKEHEHLLK